jgi:uncharacterized protein YodC (DUF2158 family)
VEKPVHAGVTARLPPRFVLMPPSTIQSTSTRGNDLKGKNMAHEFKKGDVVKLKSGGPTMTVSNIGKDTHDQEKVWCVWFEKTKKFEDTFEPGILSPALVGASRTILRS